MKRLLVICQKVDQHDDLLGFFIFWLKELASHYELVDVITLGAFSYDLPKNVRVFSLGKEKNSLRPLRFMRLIWLLLKLTPKAEAIFCHMSPIFAIIAWPFSRAFRVKLALWYLHRSLTLRFRLALFLVDFILTADANSLTIKDQKIISVGHGIDVPSFRQGRDWSWLGQRPIRILSVGRLSPIKDFGTLIKAAALLRESQIEAKVKIIGQTVRSGDSDYKIELVSLAEKLNLSKIVEFGGFVPFDQIKSFYAWADLVVGCTPPGGLDKAILEGMAAGCIILTSNKVMKPYLGQYADKLTFSFGDHLELSQKIKDLSNFQEISKFLVESVTKNHNLSQTIIRISDLL